MIDRNMLLEIDGHGFLPCLPGDFLMVSIMLMPALATRKSIGPKASRVLATMALTLVGSEHRP
jgi:hypothetical protein